jgi:hypothetical protein
MLVPCKIFALFLSFLKFFLSYNLNLFLLDTVWVVICHFICYFNRILSAQTDKIIGIIKEIR